MRKGARTVATTGPPHEKRRKGNAAWWMRLKVDGPGRTTKTLARPRTKKLGGGRRIAQTPLKKNSDGSNAWCRERKNGWKTASTVKAMRMERKKTPALENLNGKKPQRSDGENKEGMRAKSHPNAKSHRNQPGATPLAGFAEMGVSTCNPFGLKPCAGV